MFRSSLQKDSLKVTVKSNNVENGIPKART